MRENTVALSLGHEFVIKYNKGDLIIGSIGGINPII